MSKYISADELISTLNETIEKHKNSDMFTRTVRAAENMITIIKRMPSADVVEVKHGEWKPERTRFGFYCNKCKMYSYRSTNFCPSCGADMRERGET